MKSSGSVYGISMAKHPRRRSTGWLTISKWWLEIMLALIGVCIGLYITNVDGRFRNLEAAHTALIDAVRDNSTIAAAREGRFVSIEKSIEQLVEDTKDQELRIRANQERCQRAGVH